MGMKRSGAVLKEEKENKRARISIGDVSGRRPIPPVPVFKPVQLEQETPHALDSTIQFEDEGHIYRVQFDHPTGPFVTENIVSVSGLVHQFFPHFDPDTVIMKMRRSKKWPQSPYFGMSPEAIKALWKENGEYASQRGSVLHLLLECHNNGFPLGKSTYADILEVQDYFRWRQSHFDKNNLVPFRTEFKMHTGPDLSLTGTADLLAIKKDHPPPGDCDGVLTLHMIDWKFSKAISMDNHYEKGHGPCARMDNCNYNHYLLQQNIYKWFLETYYNDWVWKGHVYTSVHVESLHLAVFNERHPRDGLYVKLPVVSSIVEDMMAARRKELLSSSECV
jgi:hypothetical protein